MFTYFLVYQYGSSGYIADAEEIPGSERTTNTVLDNFLFEGFEATCHDVTSKEELLMALKSLHNNSDLLNILGALKDYELPDEILKENMLGEFKEHVPSMYNYLDVFF